MPSTCDEPLRILIADDSSTDRLLLEAIVRRQGHTPLLAADGLEALAVFREESPDIVLLDALMPNLDGFETARQIKAESGEHFVPIIFLTSLSAADSLAECLEAGGDDFLTKPYNHVILKAKINAFRRMQSMHVTLQHQRDQIAANNLRLIREQEVAKRTFDKVAHEGCLQVPNIQYRLSPLAVFNGDVLLAAPRPNGNLSVLLGDFTGHGLAAAIGAMPLSQTFYSMVAKGFSVRDVVTEMNRKLKEILPIGVFCCAVMVELDFRSLSMEFWSGGMPDSYLYRNESQKAEALAAKHLPLGILAPEKFDPSTEMIQVALDDRLYLWSDGILEATNSEGTMFGEKRLTNLFTDGVPTDQLFQHIMSAIDGFVGESGPDDDLSAAEIRIVSQQSFNHWQPQPDIETQAKPMDWELSYQLRPDTLRNFDPLAALQKHLIDIPGLQSRSGELCSIMAELYTNALEHGVLGLDSALKSTADGFANYYQQRQQRLWNLEDGSIQIDMAYKGDEESGHLQLSVADSGRGFDHASLMAKLLDDLSLPSYSGRGIALVHSLADGLEFNQQGNRVTVSMRWPRPC